jgi:translocon-associated protein subunit delta
MQKLSICLFIAFVGLVSANSCKDPVVSSKSYTTVDASVLTSIAYLTEFELTCGGQPAKIPLYAEIGGQLFNVVRGNKYQVSWTEEISKATRGDHVVNLYDDEGFAQLRKSQRSGDTPTPLATVVVNHPGAYSGPLLNSEHLAAITGVIVVYIAITCRGKLLS